MEIADVQHYEANLLYNIMIVNLAYVSIDKFSEEKADGYLEALRLFSQ
jgi:hypothetical protein